MLWSMPCSGVAMAMEAQDDGEAALEMVTFTIIIDDIVFPDGRTAMACLGGGGPQTAFGALLWLSNGERVGLASGVGEDFPDSCKDWLKTAGVDTGGLVLWPFATLRAWQILEEDGKRTEVWRVSLGEEVWQMLRPAMNLLPPLYQKARTYHAGVHPSGLDVGFLRELRNSGAEIVSVEVYTHAEEVIPFSDLQALVSTGHIFSPNEKEAASLVGPGPPLEMIGRLSELGAEIVALRRGHLGCIVHRSDTKETWEVPAFHTVIQENRENKGDMNRTKVQMLSLQGMKVKDSLDPTGCGNTFCGGFLVGWYRTRDLLTAALWGSASASFMLECEGMPQPRVSEMRTAAQLRLELLKPLAKQRRVPDVIMSGDRLTFKESCELPWLNRIVAITEALSQLMYAMEGGRRTSLRFCGATPARPPQPPRELSWNGRPTSGKASLLCTDRARAMLLTLSAGANAILQKRGTCSNSFSSTIRGRSPENAIHYCGLLLAFSMTLPELWRPGVEFRREMLRWDANRLFGRVQHRLSDVENSKELGQVMKTLQL